MRCSRAAAGGELRAPLCFPHMTTSYTIASASEFEQEIRKSRFHARAIPVTEVEEAVAFVEQTRYADARHHCWAWRIGQRYRFFDDGEPGGTAGKPILAAIDAQELDQVAVLVARWFGGIKLGTGGLMRAYGGCAAECLRRATRVEIVAYCRLRVNCDFASAAALHDQLSAYSAIKLDEAFHGDGAELILAVPEARREAFTATVRDLTRGAARIADA